VGQESDEGFVGPTPNGWSGESNLEGIAVKPDNLVPAGPGHDLHGEDHAALDLGYLELAYLLPHVSETAYDGYQDLLDDLQENDGDDRTDVNHADGRDGSTQRSQDGLGDPIKEVYGGMIGTDPDPG
jgi:hypothetical protein